jgi:UDP-GlcNAc:undecaprenyl-phosphate GlcNAc-1-phosphate transferase
MGGVAVLSGSTLALLMALPLAQWISMRYFFISVALMFLIGLRDDVLALTPRQKLFSQFLPVFVLVLLDNVKLVSFYNLSPEPFPILVTYFVSLFTVIIITNAYNLIDGIDGLAGTVGVIALTFFGIWFYLADQPFLSLVALCFAGALIAFLFFNWQPSSIFMGDTGALTIGLILSYFAIRFINLNFELSPGNPARFTGSISTAVCVLIIPIFDTLRVIILRLRKKQSPFHADRKHLHHRLLGLGFSHAGSVTRIAALNILFILLAMLMKNMPDAILLPVILGICLLISFGLKLKELSAAKSAANA